MAYIGLTMLKNPTALGNCIMDALRTVDKVAYVRFASVYRSFKDIREFGEEIARLGDESDANPN